MSGRNLVSGMAEQRMDRFGTVRCRHVRNGSCSAVPHFVACSQAGARG